MNPLLRGLYGAAGQLIRVAVASGVPGDGKLARTIAGRRGLLDRYRRFAHATRDRARPLVWFHAPSVGEGLQAVPVIARLRERRPDVQVAYTHFSPSAAAFAQKTGADFRDFLPFDIASDMRLAIESLDPSVLVFSKLDVWPILVEQAQRRNVALGLISATLAESSGRRGKFAEAFSRDAYGALQAVGAIDDADAERLVDIGVRQSVIRVTGDTRYDQVWQHAAATRASAAWLERFRSDRRITLVAGSTWPADEAVLLGVWNDILARWPGRVRLIIAPHEPTVPHLTAIDAWAAQSRVRCARLDAPDDASADVVLVDRTGVLGDLYAIADVAYVGGGFHDAGLHSVLEPAAFGAPVIFGPRYANSRDAALLIDDGGGRSVPDARAMLAIMTSWLSPDDATAREDAGERAERRVAQGVGAADRATELVMELLQTRAGVMTPA